MKSIVWGLPVFLSAVVSADDAQELAKHLPASANTITVVRVAKILGTDRAKSEDWAAKMEERFLSGAAAIPPWVDTLVVGALIHPSVPEEVWAAAVVRLPESVTMETIAAREGAQIEELSGVPCVHSRRDSFLMQPLPGLLAAYRPAHRLEASRWVRSLAADQPSSLAPYLNGAIANEGHLVLALDLSDLLDVRRIEQLLKEDPRFAPFSKTADRLVPLLAGLRGVTFSATITDSTTATVTIDFSDEVGPSALTVKSLFVGALNDLGAAIDEFADSQATGQGRSVTLTCELSDESLRRILSLIVSPSAPYEIARTAATPEPRERRSPSARTRAPQDPTAQYVAAVNKMIDDLLRANRRAKDYAHTAAWHDNFARKIEALPTEDVDRRALTYGQHVTSGFRALAASLRGQAVTINAQQGTLTYDVNYQPEWVGVSIWGAVGYQEPAYRVTSNLQHVREQQAEAIAKGAAERDQIWQLIADERGQMQSVTP